MTSTPFSRRTSAKRSCSSWATFKYGMSSNSRRSSVAGVSDSSSSPGRCSSTLLSFPISEKLWMPEYISRAPFPGMPAALSSTARTPRPVFPVRAAGTLPTVRGSFYRYYAVKYTLSKGACDVSVLLPFRVPVIPPALLPALCAIRPCPAPAARRIHRSS